MYFANFRYFWPKKGRMLSDLSSEARFGILSSFRIFEAPICYNLHLLIFDLPRIKKKNQIELAIIFFEIEFFRLDSESAPQNTAYKPVYEFDFEKNLKTGPP